MNTHEVGRSKRARICKGMNIIWSAMYQICLDYECLEFERTGIMPDCGHSEFISNFRQIEARYPHLTQAWNILRDKYTGLWRVVEPDKSF